MSSVITQLVPAFTRPSVQEDGVSLQALAFDKIRTEFMKLFFAIGINCETPTFWSDLVFWERPSLVVSCGNRLRRLQTIW